MAGKLTVLLLVLTMALSAGEQQKEERMALPANGISKLSINAGSGSLKVTGDENISEIRVDAEIIVKNIDRDEMARFIERNVTLRLEKSGSRAMLVSKVDNSWFSSNRRNAVINLTVHVPRRMALDIDDGSGSMEISHIDGDINIDDGSGSLSVEDVSGDLWIDDGSGSITVRGIRGDVDIDDGSGSLDIRDVGGNVVVADGSGSIHINGVAQDVTIREAGSGGLSISDVQGSVIRRR